MKTFAALLSTLIVPVTLAAPAHAQHYSTILDIISWNGSYCVGVTGPKTDNLNTLVDEVVCDWSGRSVANYGALPGHYVGTDVHPINAHFVSCQLWIDGRLDRSDTAYAGAGDYAGCLVTLAESGV